MCTFAYLCFIFISSLKAYVYTVQLTMQLTTPVLSISFLHVFRRYINVSCLSRLLTSKCLHHHWIPPLLERARPLCAPLSPKWMRRSLSKYDWSSRYTMQLHVHGAALVFATVEGLGHHSLSRLYSLDAGITDEYASLFVTFTANRFLSVQCFLLFVLTCSRYWLL